MSKKAVPILPIDKTTIEQLKIVLEKDEIALFNMKKDEKFRSCKRQLALAFTNMQLVRFWVDESLKRIDKVNTDGIN